MSRIGKKVIPLPDKVKLKVSGENELEVEGPKGKLEWTLPKGIALKIAEKEASVSRINDTRPVRALHGLSRALISNMVTGVSSGFSKELEIQGVGFRAAIQGKTLNLSLGKSHPINFPIPDGVKITVEGTNRVKVEGIDKQRVGQAAADIRGFYPPEPYKGKGVRYVGEKVVRKEGKTVQ
jgi:large subunit ribosomal protein L6